MMYRVILDQQKIPKYSLGTTSINKFSTWFRKLSQAIFKGFHFTNFQNLVLATTFHVPFEPQQNFDIKITRFVKLHNFLKIESLARCEKGYVDSCKDGFSFHNSCQMNDFCYLNVKDSKLTEEQVKTRTISIVISCTRTHVRIRFQV